MFVQHPFQNLHGFPYKSLIRPSAITLNFDSRVKYFRAQFSPIIYCHAVLFDYFPHNADILLFSTFFTVINHSSTMINWQVMWQLSIKWSMYNRTSFFINLYNTDCQFRIQAAKTKLVVPVMQCFSTISLVASVAKRLSSIRC